MSLVLDLGFGPYLFKESDLSSRGEPTDDRKTYHCFKTAKELMNEWVNENMQESERERV